MELTQCPNCNTRLKNTLLSSIKLLDNNKVAVINEYHEPKSTTYCTRCGEQLYQVTAKQLSAERETLIKSITPGINYIPAITMDCPPHWEYDILCIITAQSATGSGSLTDIDHTIIEYLEDKPGSLQGKIKKEEHLCFFQLRKQALNAGGNAILDVRINYTEFAGDKMMISMAGTAVRLQNSAILGEGIAQRLNNLSIYNNRYLYLTKMQSRVTNNN